MKKRITIIALAVIALGLFGWRAIVFAAGSAGTQDDPLVTVSYLNEKFKTEIIAAFDAKIAEQNAALAKKIDEKLGTVSAQPTDAPADVYYLVTLTKDQSLKCDAGTEILLREGSFTVYGANISDATTGGELSPADSAAAPLNHLYIVTAKDSGFTVTSDTAVLLVRGTYIID